MAIRATERMDLLEKIGTELQSRYTFTDIDAYFAAANISTANIECWGGANSKRVYAKAVLARVPERDVLRIADELGLLTGPGLKTLRRNRRPTGKTPRPSGCSFLTSVRTSR